MGKEACYPLSGYHAEWCGEDDILALLQARNQMTPSWVCFISRQSAGKTLDCTLIYLMKEKFTE